MELNYDKEVSDAHFGSCRLGMDAFNHSNLRKAMSSTCETIGATNTRLFTIRQDEFDDPCPLPTSHR